MARILIAPLSSLFTIILEIKWISIIIRVITSGALGDRRKTMKCDGLLPFRIKLPPKEYTAISLRDEQLVLSLTSFRGLFVDYPKSHVLFVATTFV